MQPDYYLVLPWHFRAGILQRETAFRDRGGKFIFPFPEIEIV
jgi:C-methyltransferase C-terminal domain